MFKRIFRSLSQAYEGSCRYADGAVAQIVYVVALVGLAHWTLATALKIEASFVYYGVPAIFVVGVSVVLLLEGWFYAQRNWPKSYRVPKVELGPPCSDCGETTVQNGAFTRCLNCASGYDPGFGSRTNA